MPTPISPRSTFSLVALLMFAGALPAGAESLLIENVTLVDGTGRRPMNRSQGEGLLDSPP